MKCKFGECKCGNGLYEVLEYCWIKERPGWMYIELKCEKCGDVREWNVRITDIHFKCDESNNPPEVVARNEMHVGITFTVQSGG